jgi:CBS domain-containing protein
MVRDEFRDVRPIGQSHFERSGRPFFGRESDREGSERGWWDRATDEVSSWFGDDEAERRREMDDGTGRRGEYRDNYSRRERRTGDGRDYGRRAERAADVMSTDVIRVHPEDSLRHAARMMAGYDCGALPVVDRNNRMIGMITDRDIAVRGVAEVRDAGRMPVGAAMTHDTFACHVNDSLRECMHAMAEHQVRRIPIVDDRARVVGIISQADLARHAGDGIGGRAVAHVVKEVSEPSSRPYRD